MLHSYIYIILYIFIILVCKKTKIYVIIINFYAICLLFYSWKQHLKLQFDN